MRWRRTGSLLVAAALACLVAGTAGAQQPQQPPQDRPNDTMEILREKVRADKKVIVMAALDLTDAEAKGFWPVYGAYQSDMITHYDRVAKMLDGFVKAYPDITDEMAKSMLTEFVALEADQAAILKKFVPRFERVLPPRKLARFYQLENKIRAVLNYDLAREIPLVK